MIVIVCPSLRDFKSLIEANMLINCPVTVEDNDRAMDIFGYDVPSLKGKVMSKKPNVV